MATAIKLKELDASGHVCISRRWKLSLLTLTFNLALTFKVEISIEASSELMGASLYLDCTYRGALRLPSIPNSPSPQSKNCKHVLWHSWRPPLKARRTPRTQNIQCLFMLLIVSLLAAPASV